MRLLSLIKHYWLPLTLFTVVAIATLSLWPAASLPQVPGTDKTHHFIAYGLLMLPTALKKPKGWLYIAFAFIAFSGLIELVQPYVNRYGEWLDMLANILGLLCGIFVAKLVEIFADFSYKKSQ
ncbi:VanZ family protein [Litorilituus lipolyticus]|uniref:VanZ family protein n=1 Tax=Litorilituus lipolyticus TaxID=2491017 RepID=A0A502KQA9_9GAMM|nr:VanZ family protein [Litorilituus lipolyticus]TPH13364.1 VanZ family protein [Litorilituus lipolyticus]